MKKLIFVLGLWGCSNAAPEAQVALRGPVSQRAAPSLALCECDVTCRATGQGFSGLGQTKSGACAKGLSLCQQSGCTTCVPDNNGFCE